MPRAALSLAVLVLVATTAKADHHNAEKKNKELLQKIKGTWAIDEGVNQGRKLTDKQLNGSYVKVSDKEIVTYDRDANERYRAIFVLDTSESPAQINMTSAMKRVPPSQSLGILKMGEENEWVLCYALPGHPRPEKFESPQGSKILLFEMEMLGDDDDDDEDDEDELDDDDDQEDDQEDQP